MAAMVGVMARALAALAVSAGVASCSSSGTAANPEAAVGPVHDMHLDGGALAMHWTGAQGSLGVVRGASAGTAGTGCFGWTDPDGTTHWQARVTGTVGGRLFSLELAVDGQQIPPLGTHVTIGADGADGMATLIVDGVAYRYTHADPADVKGSYFVVDNDGTTGLVWIRFASAADGPQAWKVEGRWHCA